MPDPRTRVLRRPYAAAGAAAALLLLAGCGGGTNADPPTSSGSSSSSGSAGSSSSPSQAADESGAEQTIRVRVSGDEVTPSNERIQVTAGEPIRLRVTSDRDGELHVHSSPETTFDFGPGTSTRTITIARPGIVEMEEHVSDTLVAQLEAR